MYEIDPVVEALFEGDTFVQEEPLAFADSEYGKGDWPNANIQEVRECPPSDFGRSIQLEANLDDDTKPFYFFVDVPILPDGSAEDSDPVSNEKRMRRYAAQLKRLKSIVHATGTWVTFDENRKLHSTEWPSSFADFSTDEAYEKLVSVFRVLIGKRLGLRVRYRSSKKKNGSTGSKAEVWGLDPTWT